LSEQKLKSKETNVNVDNKTEINKKNQYCPLLNSCSGFSRFDAQ